MVKENPNPLPLSSPKDYIAQLLKENTALLRLVGERNKIIERNEMELQKLRISFQQLQQQNWQLARANSQMLEELNLGKDRLKTVQHELGCTVAVLNATKLELQVKEKLTKELCNNEIIKKEQTSIKCEEAAVDPLHQAEKKACNPSRKRVSRSHSLGSAKRVSRSHSLGSVTVTSEAIIKDINRRKSSRKGDSNFKSQPPELKEDLFEIEDAKFPITSLPATPMNEDHPVKLDSSASFSPSSTLETHGEEEKDSSGFQDCPHDECHSSIARPSRRATIGVSYKELSLRVKMRRQ